MAKTFVIGQTSTCTVRAFGGRVFFGIIPRQLLNFRKIIVGHIMLDYMAWLVYLTEAKECTDRFKTKSALVTFIRYDFMTKKHLTLIWFTPPELDQFYCIFVQIRTQHLEKWGFRPPSPYPPVALPLVELLYVSM